MNSMKNILGVALLLFSLSLISHGAEYAIDPAHSKVMFKIKHLSISTVTGNFGKFSGTFDLDPSNPKSLKVNATIEVASINTDVGDRDKHLRSPEFFDADKYPQMTFVSKEVTESARNRVRIAGDLTLHGTTKPVVLDAEFGGAVKDPMGNERAAFTVSTTINRKDFGMTFDKTLDNGGLMVGDDVRIEIEVEGIKKK